MIINLILLSVGTWIGVVVGAIAFISGIGLVFEGLECGDDDEVVGGIIAVLIGILPCVFWWFIPYWNFCQWLILVVLIVITLISFTNRERDVLVRITGGITGIYSLVLLTVNLIVPYWDEVVLYEGVIHCGLFVIFATLSAVFYKRENTFLFFLFLGMACVLGVSLLVSKLIVPYWDLAITKWTTATLVAMVILFFLFVALKKNRRRRLRAKLKRVSNIPMALDAISSYRMEWLAFWSIPRLRRLTRMLKRSNGAKHDKVKRQLYDLKLKLFYAIPLKTKCGKAGVSPFEDSFVMAKYDNDYALLRRDRDEYEIVHQEETQMDKELSHCAKDASKIKTDMLLKNLKSIRNQDVESRFLFFHWISSRKVEKQTEDYKRLLDETVNLYNRMLTYATKLNEQLSYIRLCAYRNLYLGIELLDYDREIPVGGNSLHTIVDDDGFVTTDVPNVTNLAYKTRFSQELIETADDIADVIIGLFTERWEMIEECSELQLQIIQEMDRMIGQMQEYEAWVARANEVARSVVEANKGYMAVYAPLRDKVFVRGERLSMEDVSVLTKILNAYNRISANKI